MPVGKHFSGRSKQSKLLGGLITVLILGGLSAMLGSWNALSPSPASPRLTVPSSAPQIIGSAEFESSGKFDTQMTEGINDELQIDLGPIPDPDPGTAYYAWLLPDAGKGLTSSILLGRLTVSHAAVHFLYGGEEQHTNLLSSMSRLLVTEEDATVLPPTPSPDQHRWRFYGEIPQRSPSADSLLDHLRFLLSHAPSMSGVMNALSLPGGLRIWFLLTSRDVLEWASAARGENVPEAPSFLRVDVIRILDVLDGSILVSQDVPAGTPLYVTAPLAQVPLLPEETGQQPPDFLSQIGMQLAAIAHAADATPEQRQAAISLTNYLNLVANALEQERQDARALLMLSDLQLGQPKALSLLDDLVEQATVAFAGVLNPASGERTGGTLWITDRLEHLATITVKRCVACRI